MKYLKKFEVILDNYKVGDYYLVCNTDQPVKIIKNLTYEN